MSTHKSEPSQEKKTFFDRLKEGPDSRRNLIKSTSILSAGTLASRILGFFRDVILARLLGTGFRADAFFVALKIPNLFRDLVGEGAVNAAVVPVLSEYHAKEREAFWNFISVIFCLSLIILSGITILGIIGSPFIVRAIAPGFISEPSKLLLTIELTRFMFPYLIFIGITAYAIGILHTFRSFVVPAFAPCLLNISIIISALIAGRYMEEPVYGLAIGVLIGGVLQLLAQIPPLLKSGVRFRPPKTLRHPGAKKIGKLLLPRLVGSGVYQLTVLVDTFCASLAAIVGAGGISAIYYANRIIQFPMGIFSVAMASALLPSLSDMAHKKDMESIKKTVVFSLENIFFVMCPTMVILMLLANPIIRVLFQRGEFGAYSTDITAGVLSFYAIGLFSFGGIKILVTAFHALQDTKTPVKAAALCLVINATLNFILMGPLKVGGIALASSIAGTIDFFILFWIMDRRLGGFNSGLLMFFAKVILASMCTGIFVYWGWQNLAGSELIKLIVIGIAGMFFYGFICVTLVVEQARKIWNWMTQNNHHD